MAVDSLEAGAMELADWQEQRLVALENTDSQGGLPSEDL